MYRTSTEPPIGQYQITPAAKADTRQQDHIDAVSEQLADAGITLEETTILQGGTRHFKSAQGTYTMVVGTDGTPSYSLALAQILASVKIPDAGPRNSAQDTQVGGDHYKSMKIQPWAVMRAVFTREEMIGYHTGTVIAYLMRHKAKGGEQDIKKAQHHLTELVEYLNETPKV